MMFPHTVTIYNKIAESNFQRTVLSGVFWDSSKGAVVRKTGVSSADGLMLVIPMDAEVLSKRLYRKPKEWAALEDKTAFFTLQSGDIVALGNIEYEVTRSSKELQQFDDVLTISNVDTRNYGGGMSHFEITGR